MKKLIKECFEEDVVDRIWGLGESIRDSIIRSTSSLLSFCQEVLEWAMIWEILNLELIQSSDIILKDGALRSNNIKQKYLLKLGEKAKEKGIYVIAVTKNSPVKLELSSTYKKIDNFLESEKKPTYPFTIENPRWQKLCCWFEVPDEYLYRAYPDKKQRELLATGKIDKITTTSMYAKKGLTGGRGFGLFFSARLDYVEKLQNYDWVLIDLNLFDCLPNIQAGDLSTKNLEIISNVFRELTRLTQEHYILGYPYPLVEAHNFISLKRDFKDEVVKRVKASLYRIQRMDNVDIENLFLDIHDRF